LLKDAADWHGHTASCTAATTTGMMLASIQFEYYHHLAAHNVRVSQALQPWRCKLMPMMRMSETVPARGRRVTLRFACMSAAAADRPYVGIRNLERLT
jgi:hypothetical protein